jgi:hypothetical protein
MGGSDFFGNIGNVAGGLWDMMTNKSGTLPGMADAMWAPALATAYKQWQDSGKYMDTARQAANISNPAGDRSLYVNKLRDLYTNPNAILSDPSYQFRLNQGLGNANRHLAASGYSGSGKQAVDLNKFAQDYASTEWDKEVQRLSNLGGFQFDPANAGKMLMTGQEQGIKSQNAALASMFYPMLMKSVANTQQNRPGMGGSGGGFMTQAINAGGKAVMDAAGSIAKIFMPDGTVYNSSGQQIGVQDQYGNVVPSYRYDGGPSIGNGGNDFAGAGVGYDPSSNYNWDMPSTDTSGWTGGYDLGGGGDNGWINDVINFWGD